MLYHYLLDGQGLDQKVVADLVLENTLRLKKSDIMPERNYQNLVDRIAKWLDCWLSCAIPSPSELIALLSEAFLLVMKGKRMTPTMENYLIFVDNIRADVIKVLAKDYLKTNKGISTNFPYKK